MGMVDQHVSSCEGMKDEFENGFLEFFTLGWVSCGADAMKERQERMGALSYFSLCINYEDMLLICSGLPISLIEEK